MSDLTERGRLDRVYNDVYFGNGKPGLTTRMQSAEERQDAMDARCDKSDKKLGRIELMFWTIIVLLITVLVQNQFSRPTHAAEVPAGHSLSY